ncbi:Uncharacterized protein FWK35_00000358 [Aphis craccivora]|uniref:Uncharacterized protein n=1 Tax=Aphis craccivora TaxID=307492 RepID=A0A6G0ZQ79_APHCR|nr:Uncharacterized protein FWK35_00000358 [Aphis craccivora]
MEDIRPVLNDIRDEERTISVASWLALWDRSIKGDGLTGYYPIYRGDESDRRQWLRTQPSLGGRRRVHHFPLSSLGRSPNKDVALPQRSATPALRRNQLPWRLPPATGADDQRFGIREEFHRTLVAQRKTKQQLPERKRPWSSLRSIRGYWTTSADPSSVFLCVVPANILVLEWVRIYERMTEYIRPVLNNTREQERTMSVASWLARWDRSIKDNGLTGYYPIYRAHLSLDPDADRPRVLSAISTQDESGRRQWLRTQPSLGGRRGAHHFPLSSRLGGPNKDLALPRRSATLSR